MGLAERIAAARTFDRSRFKPFRVDGAAIGYVRHDLAAHLREFPDVFTIADCGVTFAPGLTSCDTRSAAMADVARALEARHMLTPWRNETYDIGKARDGACIFRLERAAVRYFGCMAHAVHVNGLVTAGETCSMWIARRSHDKAIDPGMLDNMVGGGLASGLTIRETLVKEAWEEAGVPAELAGEARCAGSLRIAREVPEGLHLETIHLHDLHLPPAFEPRNQDGEVAELRRFSCGEVLAQLTGDAAFTVDAALVAMECLVRHQLLDERWSNAIHEANFNSPD